MIRIGEQQVCAGPLTDACGAGWILRLERGEAFAQTGSILLADVERSTAAIPATGTADQPRSAFARRFGERRVNDLDEPGIVPHKTTI